MHAASQRCPTTIARGGGGSAAIPCSPREPLSVLVFGDPALEAALHKPGPLHGTETFVTRDPEQEFFADGMTEALITRLARIAALHVISLTTAMRYKQADRPLPDIARELGVEAIVEGSVLVAGRRMRVSVRLSDAKAHVKELLYIFCAPEIAPVVQ